MIEIRNGPGIGIPVVFISQRRDKKIRLRYIQRDKFDFRIQFGSLYYRTGKGTARNDQKITAFRNCRGDGGKMRLRGVLLRFIKTKIDMIVVTEIAADFIDRLIISLIGNISVGRDHGGLDISLIRGNHGDRIISAGRRGETTGTHRQDHTQGQQNSQDFSHERNSSLKRIRIFFSIPYPEKTKKMRCIMTAGYISSVVICRQRERRL